MPRPSGRRWARLRSGGSRATQVIARVARRHPDATSVVGLGPQVVFPRQDSSWRRIAARRSVGHGVNTDELRAEDLSAAELTALAPVSPAIGSNRLVDDSASSGQTTIPLLPGERTPVRRIKFAVVNGCTVASLLLGMAAVFSAMSGDFRLAGVMLLACVVFDGCDGALARKFGVASPFGAQMDSLADLSSFGVATGFVVYLWLVAQGAPPAGAAAACALVVVCAAIRLARFNVSPKSGRFFSGVPTTMAAAVLALNILLGPELAPVILVGAVAVYALAMVTSFPYAKLVSVLRLPLWLAVVPVIGFMVSVEATFAVVVGGYLVSGPMLWLYQRRQHTFAI